MKGKGILSDLLGEYLIVETDSQAPETLYSSMKFFLSKRYFMEKIEDGLLAGEDKFMTPHWVSFSENWAFRVDHFPEPREFEIYQPENTV